MPPRMSRFSHALTLLPVALVASTLVALGGSAAQPALTSASSTLVAAKQSSGAWPRKQRSDTVKPAGRATVHVATLNLKNTMSQSGVTHDIRQVINKGGPSVIGFQERGGSKGQMLRALPKHWSLVMPTGRSGTDLNPIAFDRRVWKLKNSFSSLLTNNTWRRNRGNIAIDQYAVVANLKHRITGQVVRAASFHMPPEIHSRSGAPRYGPRVEAFWRMAGSVDRLGRRTPQGVQFLAMCDCNVAASRDNTDKLLRGKIIRPLDLVTNYDVRAPTRGKTIDYVMTPRDDNFDIVDAIKLDGGLVTDHPAIVTKLKESKAAYRERTTYEVASLFLTREQQDQAAQSEPVEAEPAQP